MRNYYRETYREDTTVTKLDYRNCGFSSFFLFITKSKWKYLRTITLPGVE